MLPWISENLGTIIISLLLIAAVYGIIVSMLKNKKKGKSSCGCNCGNCPMSGSCHHGK
ncbi:MAG: FeoB-associated Cys-rich membrane protein [Firmicutes bacterium HGW-Firmicutes-16]|nr:MAG: FeoB-associated Cys-rich membrane protein [Firmicutes bacterium HGW-Firmicutes-16]